MQPQNYWQSNEGQTPAPQAQPPQADAAPVQPMAASPPSSDEILTWEASEFVHHEKSGMWFLVLLLMAIVLLVVDYFFIKSLTFGVLIVVMALAAGVIARRPPRTLSYALSPEGISVDQKFFSFHDFRAFGVVQEGAFYSVRLVPSKRFMPMVSVFFPTEMSEQIVDVFGAVLPMERIERDPLDKLAEKIRF